MSECPFHKTMKMRPELAELAVRMKSLPLDKRGYPVPWFVAWVDGEPEFRAMDHEKWQRAARERLCWVCGGKLGVHLVFVIGPMCGINHISSEPPSHLECARWSACNCPFLTLRMKKRAEDDLINNQTLVQSSAGVAITRNPGVALLWKTKSYRVVPDSMGKGGQLIQIGPAQGVEWYAHGRPATRAEVEESVRTGLPTLQNMARLEGDEALAELATMEAALQKLYPAAAINERAVRDA